MFIHQNFLLNNEHARILYFDYAKDMPICDYHCHLSPKEIYENKRFKNITEAWLGGDHYKWRAMRSNGISEEYITGKASDYEKFLAWSQTVPKLIGNPLYHWTHMELKMVFNVNEILKEKTAKLVWEQCNEVINRENFNARQLIEQSHVQFIGTTDDPTDDLMYHQLIKEDQTFQVMVLPSFRPDKAVDIEKAPFIDYIDKLGQVVGYKLDTVEKVITALLERMDYFYKNGCKLSDHGLDFMPFAEGTITEVEAIFSKKLKGDSLTFHEINQYKTYVLTELGKKYSEYNWVLQLHIGAMRNNNTKMFQQLGPDTGFDSINDYPVANPLAKFLNKLDLSNQLPKTILYTLNPRDNYVLASMIGNFMTDGLAGKIQFGSGWWFNDQKSGMLDQMTTLANVGLLSHFIGMLTDSRSLLSYARHDYFRRILCSLLGNWVELGEVPPDYDLLGKMVQDICFHNANRFIFNL